MNRRYSEESPITVTPHVCCYRFPTVAPNTRRLQIVRRVRTTLGDRLDVVDVSCWRAMTLALDLAGRVRGEVFGPYPLPLWAIVLGRPLLAWSSDLVLRAATT